MGSALVKTFGSWVAAVVVALVFAATSGTNVHAETYSFDKDHTAVTFSWGHLGLSRQSGRIRELEGRLEFDPANPEAGKVDVTLKVASLWTGVPALDTHLKSPDFFNADEHPTITFKSTAARKTGEKTGEVTGDLTIMGMTRPITLQVRWNYTGEHPLSTVNPIYKGKFVSGFSATAQLLRSEWGVSRAVPLVSDEIHISIETELLRE